MPEEHIKKILIITRNLPPLVGGMERLNWHMADELSKQAQVHIISPKGSARMKPASVTLSEVSLKPLPLFLAAAFLKGLYAALSTKPNIILAGSGLTAPIAWLLSKLSGARSAAYLHGFDITVNNALYRKMWQPTFKRLDRVIVNSTPTRQLALNAGVTESKTTIVYPGVSLPSAPQPSASITAFKEQHGLIDKKILLSVGRLTTRKGLLEFVEKSLPLIVRSEPNAVLVVVGEAPKNSLGAGIQSVASIQAQATKSGVAGHIKFLGVITDRDLLATVYEAADVHVFPVRHIPDDPEGFGMVAIEAAAHGVPTVTFASGGIVDAIAPHESGYLITSGDYTAFAEKSIEILTRGPISWNTKPRKFAASFAWPEFGQRLYLALHAQGAPLRLGANWQTIKSTTEPKRKPHAASDLTLRELKAKKIETLLNLAPSDNSLRLLEIGCGSGKISHYFATHPDINFNVVAVDVSDSRLVSEKYEYLQVQDTKLPFKSNAFDIVISNHVIEHVGDARAQAQHLAEIARVLKIGAKGYLAVPNRWMLREPHYGVNFLSWLPKRWRTSYLQWTGKGEHYDCEPMTLKEIEGMMTGAGICFENISVPAARLAFEMEKPKSLVAKLLRRLPDSLLNYFQPVIPTLIYRLGPRK